MRLQTGSPPAATLSIRVYPTAHNHPESIAAWSLEIIPLLSFLLEKYCLNHNLKLVINRKEISFKHFLFCFILV